MPNDENKAEQKKEVFNVCPHCGHRLSPWQQVLLSVDRALTCKNCWYRIILDPRTDVKITSKIDNKKNKPNEE